MVDINNYIEEKSCVYKDEEYLVRDNGAVLRKARPNQKTRKHDNEWTFGTKNPGNGYSFFFGSKHRIHQIVATAFHGEAPAKEYVVDHIDTNRQNNRPNNLKWVTKEENILNNETTCIKIKYRTGVSAEEFLADPSKYRSYFEKTDVSHMRPVTPIEEIAYATNIKKLGASKKSHTNRKPQKLENWIYNIRDPYVKMEQWSGSDDTLNDHC